MLIPCLGRSDLGKKGIVGRDKNGSMDVVRGVMKGVGMRDWENGKGGEGGGTIVGSSGECIGLPICCERHIDVHYCHNSELTQIHE